MNWKLVKMHFKESQQHHTAMSKEHVGLAEQHHRAADHHEKEGNHELHGIEKAKAAHHEKVSQHHASRAEHFEMLHSEAAHKAAEDELAKNRAEAQPVPAGISGGVLPDNPRLRAIPREGQRPISAVDKSKIPLELQEAFLVEPS